MPKTNNPLAAYFRQPAIYLRLPSRGQGWPPGSLDMPANGELPVFPMTAMDEITYRTPDALFNGQAVVTVIQSCMPNIRDAWAIPSIDLDSILVSIRIASYGHSMDIETECPSCETETTFGLDLRSITDNLSAADYTQPLSVGDLKIFARPLNYKEITENSQVQFEQQKTLQLLGDVEAPEETKVEKLNEMLKKIMEVTVDSIAHSISEIRSADAIIQESEYISEFLKNCDSNTFNIIRDFVIGLKEKSEIKPIKIKCPQCQYDYQQAFTLDMARFFASAS